MKKFLVVVLAFAVAIGLVAAMGCSKTATGPTDAQKTQTAVANANATATAIAAPVVFDFTTGIQGFAAGTGGDEGALTNLTQITTDGTTTSPAGCLQMDANYTAGSATLSKGALTYTLPALKDFTGRTITFHVKVPAVAANGSAANCGQELNWAIYIQDAGSGYAAGGYSCFAVADGGAWKTLSVSADTLGASFLTGVGKIGIQLFRNSGASATYDVSSDHFYIDEVSY